MKKLIPLFFVVLTFAACRQANKDDARDIQLLTDSTVFTNNNVYSDTIAGLQADDQNKANQQLPEAESKAPREKVIVKYVPVKTVVVKQEKASAATPPVATPPIVNNSGNSGSETVNTGNQIPDAGTPGEVTKEEKKGWSKAAQGAVIGGVAGAVGGAIISKKKGVGAVVGAVVGAAGGYIIGKKKDKKDQTKNKFLQFNP